MADDQNNYWSHDILDRTSGPYTLDLQDGDYDCINRDLLNILSVNINSITKEGRLAEVEALAHDLSLDILCVQETKHDVSVPKSKYLIQGYNVEECSRTRHGGGLITYIKEHIPHQRFAQLESTVSELEHLCVDVTVNKLKYCVSNMYRPPNDSPASRDIFISELEKVLRKINRHRAHTRVILGDLNFGNCYNNNGGLHVKQLDDVAPDVFLENNFYQLIDIPTRRVGTSCSLIDLIYSSKKENVVSRAVLLPLADHSCTLICLNSLTFKMAPKIMTKYDFDAANWEAIKQDVIKIEASDIFETDDINLLTMTISTELAKLTEHVPSKEVTLNDKDQPWFNNDVRRKLRRRNRVFSKYKKINNIYNSQLGNRANLEAKVIILFADYKKASSDYRHSARKSKALYFKEVNKMLHNPDISPRNKFKLLNRLTNSGKNTNIPPLIEAGEVVHQPKEKADIFMEMFAMKAELPGRNDDAPEPIPNQYAGSLSSFNTSPHELGPILKNLKISEKSPCSIPSKLLKLTYEKAGGKLTKIISKLLNKIFAAGQFPDCWKIAHVTPVYKKSGPMTEKTNFRPISILPTISKICESVIHNRLLDHLMCNKLISEKQSAYLRGDSTAQQLLYITHKIRKSWAEGKITHGVFLDVSAAFDKVWHKGLFTKLESSNVRDKALDLLKSYLTGRKA